jgi:hypothetical protein
MTSGVIDEDDRSVFTRCNGADSFWGQRSIRQWVGEDRAFVGDLTPHQYSGFRSSNFHGRFRRRIYVDGTLFQECHQPYTIGDYITIPGWTQDAEYALLAKLQKKINQHEWNAGVFIGELGETTDMMAQSFRTLTSAARLVRKGNFYGAARVLKVSPHVPKKRSPTSDWLALRYGWRPLCSDIYNLSQAIKKLDEPRGAVFRATHFLTNDINSVWSFVGSVQHRQSLILYATEKPFSLQDYLGLSDPATIAWELLPWSFVVDWSIPIGSYISFRSTFGRTEGKYVRSRFQWFSARITGGVIADPPGYIQTIDDEPIGSSSFYSLNRSITSTLDVNLPNFRNPLGSNPGTRLADAVSLFASAMHVLGGGKGSSLHGS